MNSSNISRRETYLDNNVERLRYLCHQFDVPFNAKKSQKCGKRCRVVLAKTGYLKVQFQDGSEFWFPRDAIRLKVSSRDEFYSTRKGHVARNTTCRPVIQSYGAEKWTNPPPVHQYQMQEPNVRVYSDEKAPTEFISGYPSVELISNTRRRALPITNAVNFGKVGVSTTEKDWEDLDLMQIARQRSRLSKSLAFSSSKRKTDFGTTASYSCRSSKKSSTLPFQGSTLPSYKATGEFLAGKTEPIGIPSAIIRDTTIKTDACNFNPTEISPLRSTVSIPSSLPYRSLQYGSNHTRSHYPVGLDNLRNTCYMNAALQCLLNNKMITQSVEYYYAAKYRPEIKDLARSFVCFAKRYALVGEKPNRRISPVNFRDAFIKVYPEFEGPCAHDSSEFLSYLLGEIGDIPTGDHKYPTVDSLFRIYCRLERRARKNSPPMTSKDSQLLMSVPVVITQRRGKRQVELKLSDLEEAIAYETLYTRHESEITLHGQRYLSFEQRSTIIAERTPPFLIIHMKKFTVNKGYFNRTNIGKLSVNLHVPLEFDISLFTDNAEVSNKYVLVSAICHLGATVSSGHYYSVIKPYKENNWFKANDLSVTEISSIKPVMKHFYVCVYRKVST